MKHQILFVLGVALSLFTASAHADSAWNRDKATTHASVDLNGDGKLDKIKLEQVKGRNSTEIGYKLSVNGAVVFGSTSGYERPQFFIADINRKDRFKEIVIQTPTGSGEADGGIYWYKGHKIQQTYKINSNWITFKGNGTVAVSHWEGFWACEEMFKLDGNHRLVKVPQKFYSLNQKGTVSKKLPLRKQPGKADIAATLPVGTKITIIKSNSSKGWGNPDTWYYVRADNGTAGWMRDDEALGHIRDLPYSNG